MSRMHHLCRRGLHELDFLLQGLPERAMGELGPADRGRLEALLVEVSDPVLLGWLLGTVEPAHQVCDLVAWMRHGAVAAAS
jgi:succinate dehydrogenase flavin-adding protein (antitoxin of CptAB toxin-antitoxin module)